MDTTTLRVAYSLLQAADAVYLPEAEACTCAGCGAPTTTRDGYDVDTPLGTVWVCINCNRNPLMWDAAQVFFTATVQA